MKISELLLNPLVDTSEGYDPHVIQSILEAFQAPRSDFPYGVGLTVGISAVVTGLAIDFLADNQTPSQRETVEQYCAEIIGQALHAFDINSNCYFSINNIGSLKQRLIAFLHERQLIERKNGVWRSDANMSYASTLKATQALANLFPRRHHSHVRKAKIRKRLIQVRDQHKNTVRKALPNGMHSSMLRLNRFLRSVQVTDGVTVWDGFQYHRVFNLDLLHGGRIYCEFSRMSKLNRSRLRINGNATVELDFSAMHINLAYVYAGLPLPCGDPYDVAGFSRNQMKVASLIALNGGTARAVKSHWIEKCLGSTTWVEAMESWKFSEEAKQAVKAFKLHHKGLKSIWKLKRIGVKLQYLESQIIIRCLMRMLDLQIPGICLHDSIRVEQKHAETVHQIMEEESAAICGNPLNIT